MITGHDNKVVVGDEISGHGQKGDRVEIQRVSSTPPTNGPRCPNCHSPIGPGHQFCEACGAALSG